MAELDQVASLQRHFERDSDLDDLGSVFLLLPRMFDLLRRGCLQDEQVTLGHEKVDDRSDAGTGDCGKQWRVIDADGPVCFGCGGHGVTCLYV